MIAIAVSATAFVATTGIASAHSVSRIVYSGHSFDGTGSTAGQFESLYGLAVDTAHQKVYTMEQGHGGKVSRFNLSGVADPFSGLAGASSLAVGGVGFQDVGMTVDNSPGATGSFYVVPQHGGPVEGFEFDGVAKGGSFPLTQVSSACSVAVDPQGNLWYADGTGHMVEVDPTTGIETGHVVSPQTRPCQSAIDSHGNFYTAEAGGASGTLAKKVDSEGHLQYELAIPRGFQSVDGFTVDPSNDHVYVLYGEWVQFLGNTVYEFEPNNPEPIYEFPVEHATAIGVDGTTHNLYVTEGAGFGATEVKIYEHEPSIIVPDVTTNAAAPSPTTAILHGTINPDGLTTTDCHFDWGKTTEYEESAPCSQGNSLSGTGNIEVTATVTGLIKGASYHVRLSAKNSNNFVVKGKDQGFTAQDLPKVSNEYVSDVHTEGATVNADVNAEAGTTHVHVEFGTDTGYGTDAPAPDFTLPTKANVRGVELALHDLEPDTEYHYRVVATNAAGQTVSTADHTFTTYPFVPVINDPCPNALARQQTGAALLLDCRAFELASATNSGGYDIESDLVAGQEPFNAYPLANGRVLYGVHDGGIPGTGSPTNHGVDPYLATRGEDGWSTQYVGIPASGTPSLAPFASTLLAADQGLDTFAFGGANICAPCFADSTTGIPVRDGHGSLIQGMAGTLNPGAAAVPDGLVASPISGDGSHLIFGSVLRFQMDGNNNVGDVSIYDRDLNTGVTQVVSKDPAGVNLTCLQGAGSCHSPTDTAGIAELAVSHDGSRIVVAQKVANDVAGNNYWHPYMHIGSSPNTVDLAPGTATGVLFDGMTAGGSKVFLTTKDKLSAADTDSSADIYEDELSGAGPVTPKLISTSSNGTPSNSNVCTPVIDWNTVSGGPNCDAVAFAGGSSVAAGDGTFYFVSPEQLDGANGELNQANLYVVRPGHNPEFVATMDSSVGKPQEPRSHPVKNSSLIAGLSTPESLAVNQATEDIYVAESGAGRVSRFTSAGAPANFAVTPGSNHITGLELGGAAEGEIAIDNAPHAPGSPFKEALYVTSNGGTVQLYANSGEHIGTISGFSEACGVAVDQSSGVVYVGDYGHEGVWRLDPISNAEPVTSANYSITSIRIPEGFGPCQVGADTEGHVYASSYSQGPLKVFNAFDFDAAGHYRFSSPRSGTANTLTTDSGNDDAYVDAGDRINVFDSSGALKEELATGVISGSRGVAINTTTHHVYASTGSKIVELDSVPPSEPIDNPALVHAVTQAAVHNYGDFQISADGHFAAFASSVSSTAYDSSAHREVYRYDALNQNLECASCPRTNARAAGDASLASHGLSLTEDGRVFFNSTDPLVLRDTDGLMDPYEWSPGGEQQLISQGTSLFGSGLLSVSADGTDAYFFTRDHLAPEDHNGTTMRIYDARERGGFFDVPVPPPCAASDECHGPGTQAGAPPNIGSLTSTPGNLLHAGRSRCKKGFVRKGGQCVKKHSRRHHHDRRHG
jgi:streptogramin lyase